MSAVLTAQGLQKSFGAVRAAADISLTFDPDTVVSLIVPTVPERRPFST